MRTWSLGTNDPRALRLAADALAGPTDYADDQIWDVQLGGGHPPALAVETSYGRRARAMRLYAGFAAEGPTKIDPASFVHPPEVTAFLPSWLRLRFEPIDGLEVEGELWVPESHTIAGRFRLTNASLRFQSVRLILYAVLDPAGEGRPVEPETRGGAVVLAGRTGGLAPLVFLSGGAAPEAGVVPALSLTLDIAPRAVRAATWACSAKRTVGDSFEAARAAAGRSWEAEIARLERLHSRWVEVETGRADWDAVLAWGQKVALGSFVGPTRATPLPSLVLSRSPDDGYSRAGDGSDYDAEWSGADFRTASYVARQIVYSAPELAKAVVEGFLATQMPDGAVDGKPGPGGQRGHWLCPPRLASLTWAVYQHSGDQDFVAEAFPKLLRFFARWFGQDHDPGSLGLPAWDNVLQTGADSRPALSMEKAWGEGIDPKFVVPPDLLAALLAEAEALVQMGETLGQEFDRSQLEHRQSALRQTLAESWSPESATFHYVDRETRQVMRASPVGESLGPHEWRKPTAFDPPSRITIWVGTSEGRARRLRVSLEGKGARGRPHRERLTTRRFRWLWDQGLATSEGVYSRLDEVHVEGIAPDVRVVVRSAGLNRQDLNLLLPIGSQVLPPQAVAAAVRRTLMNPDRYSRPCGWPTVPADDASYAPGTPGGPWIVDLDLQARIGEALVQAGYAQDAYAVLERILSCLAQVLQSDGGFRKAYNPELPEGRGALDHVGGVAPLSLLLAVAGVDLRSPNRVELRGRHVFPGPLIIRWRGLRLERSAVGTHVVFPDGQETFLDPGAEGVVERVAEAG